MQLGDLAILGDDSQRPEPKLNMPNGAAYRRSNVIDPTARSRATTSRLARDEDDEDELLILVRCLLTELG